MKDLTMTVTGWVATDPRLVVTRDGAGPTMCTFRLAQTSRYFDRSTDKWTDGNTEWFTVRVFRDSARLVAESVRTGQPVIVEGRLRTNEWTDAQKVTHWGLQLDATCVGHDLTKGLATFTRAVVTGGEEEAPEDEPVDSLPDDDTAPITDPAEDSEDAEEEADGRPAALV
ncbi:single-stranded DNA-binding protein [Demequina aestuarii]|uniref:single-stranded DNA-binding protein n=1 Tax=Demequina aestuarii TaxID=327095 RepID=UPI0007808781|nr:single-stranded DNA-binding protein [Demequina aestuarii]